MFEILTIKRWVRGVWEGSPQQEAGPRLRATDRPALSPKARLGWKGARGPQPCALTQAHLSCSPTPGWPSTGQVHGALQGAYVTSQVSQLSRKRSSDSPYTHTACYWFLNGQYDRLKFFKKMSFAGLNIFHFNFLIHSAMNRLFV